MVDLAMIAKVVEVRDGSCGLVVIYDEDHMLAG
jgi:hypothetical protein